MRRTTAVFLALALCGWHVPATADSGRSTLDRPDLIRGPQVHVIYFLPSDGVDRALDSDRTIADGIDRMQGWFAREGGSRWRIDRVAGGDVDITFIRGAHDNNHYISGGVAEAGSPLGQELADLGFGRGEKKYLIFYGGETNDSAICGTSSYGIPAPRTYLPGSEEWYGTQYATVFLRSGCRTTWGAGDLAGHLEGTAMHELVHTLTLVPPGAPHGCGIAPVVVPGAGHVCTFHGALLAAPQLLIGLDPERTDLMFPFDLYPLNELELDIGHDDYFQAPAALHDLSRSSFVERI